MALTRHTYINQLNKSVWRFAHFKAFTTLIVSFIIFYIFIFLLILRKRFYSRKHQVPYQTRAMILNNWKGYERCKQMNNFQFFNNKKNHKTVCELDSVHGRPFARSLDHSLTCTCANTFIFLPSHRFDCSVTISRYHDFNYIHIFFFFSFW